MALSITHSSNVATWQGYPEPACLDELQYITPEELHKHIIASQEAETYADKLHVLDVRQMDANDFLVAGAINVPAQTFYPSRHAILRLLLASRPSSGFINIVLHCRSGKSRRDVLCAGWLQDALDTSQSSAKVCIYVLRGGAFGMIERYADDPNIIVKLPLELQRTY